jgi:hypothetical protein
MPGVSVRGGETDRWDQTGSGSPVGAVLPRNVGALYRDTTNKLTYIATGPLNTNWTLKTSSPSKGTGVSG